VAQSLQPPETLGAIGWRRSRAGRRPLPGA